MVLPDQEKICVIGVGNEYRGDDAAGLLVARRLMEKNPRSATVVQQSGEATALMDAMCGRTAVILVDAMQSGARGGTISRFDARANPLPTSFFRCSTHIIGVGEAIELARALNHLPQYVSVYGIEGTRFEPGNDPSPEVVSALDRVVEQVVDEIQNMRIKGF